VLLHLSTVDKARGATGSGGQVWIDCGHWKPIVDISTIIVRLRKRFFTLGDVGQAASKTGRSETHETKWLSIAAS
jgi:hypothetical protein